MLTVAELRRLLADAGPVLPAVMLRGVRAAVRADVALARLREAGVSPERVLAVYLSVIAAIKADGSLDSSSTFRRTQVGKSLHRLHATGRGPAHGGFPTNTGRVVDEIGKRVEWICAHVAAEAVAALVADQARPT